MLTQHLQIFSDLLSIGATINFVPEEVPEFILYTQNESGKCKNILETDLKEFEKHECVSRFVRARVAENLYHTDPTREYQDILHELTSKRYDLDDNEKREFVHFLKTVGWLIAAYKSNKFPHVYE